jgi:hypothetical protein
MRVPDYDPLKRMRATRAYLESPAGQGLVSDEFIDTVLDPRMDAAERDLRQLNEIVADRSLPRVIAQDDVTPSNVRRDKKRRQTLTDLGDLSKGPKEITLGRPLGQWHDNFGRPVSWAGNLRRGFELVTGRLDPDVLERAVRISNFRYATTPIDEMVDAIRHGEQPNAWATHEGPRRLATLDEPNVRWYSQTDYLLGNVEIPGA